MARSVLDLEIVQTKDALDKFSTRPGEESTVRLSWTFQAMAENRKINLALGSQQAQPLIFPARFREGPTKILDLAVVKPESSETMAPATSRIAPQEGQNHPVPDTPVPPAALPASPPPSAANDFALEWNVEPMGSATRFTSPEEFEIRRPRPPRSHLTGVAMDRKKQSILAAAGQPSNWVGLELLPELAYMALDLKALAGELSWTGERLKDVPFMPLDKKAALFKAAMEDYDPSLLRAAYRLYSQPKFRY